MQLLSKLLLVPSWPSQGFQGQKLRGDPKHLSPDQDYL